MPEQTVGVDLATIYTEAEVATEARRKAQHVYNAMVDAERAALHALNEAHQNEERAWKVLQEAKQVADLEMLEIYNQMIAARDTATACRNTLFRMYRDAQP